MTKFLIVVEYSKDLEVGLMSALLKSIFFMNSDCITKTLLTLKMTGNAVFGVYSRDVAEVKMSQISKFAEKTKVPFAFHMEKFY